MADLNTPSSLNLPSKYQHNDTTANQSSSSPSPSVEWLARTWTVTHSTLSMWHSARNVRITYKPLPSTPSGHTRIDDLVEYEPISKPLGTTLKTVAGIDTSATPTTTHADNNENASSYHSWNWRGKGWLFFVSSHWEVLGWGEATAADGGVERWAVTWFAPTVFTKEGIDIYCDRREGLGEATFRKIEDALKGMETRELVSMVEKHMRPVEIQLPWTEKK